MKARVRELIQIGDGLFNKRQPLMSRWQDIAEHFYPERADFTTDRSLGHDFAGHLATSYPMIARRELGNVISSMLRPRGRPWFTIETEDEELNKRPDIAQALEMLTTLLTKFMYNPLAGFTRAMKEGDNDFVTFGQTVLTVEPNKNRDGALYRCWHLRDVAWMEDEHQQCNYVHRRWRPSAMELHRLFKGKVHPDVAKACEKEPDKKFNCREIVIPFDSYDYTGDKAKRKQPFPFITLVIDCDNQFILGETPSNLNKYIIPRWQTVSGSQYAHSPATIIALPDARLIQRMSITLLEAGEKSVNPPMIGVSEALRGDLNIMAGGFTAIDATYDERLGEVLRPLTQDRGGLAFGMDMTQDIREMISQAFFLNKINLPDIGGMTAFETAKRMEEYVRAAVPLFEPMETEHNAPSCGKSFEVMMDIAGDNLVRTVGLPQELAGREIKFAFTSPLQSAQKRAGAQSFQETANLLQIAAGMYQIEQMGPVPIKIDAALRDAMRGVEAPADWLKTDDEMEAELQVREQAAEMQQMAAAVQQGATIGKEVGGAAEALQAGGVI